MNSALARRTFRLLAVVWCLAVLLAGAVNLAVERTGPGIGVLVVGLLAPVIVYFRRAELTPRTPTGPRWRR